jgi:hypothetical protein
MITQDPPSRSTPDLRNHNDLGVTDAVSPVRNINVSKPGNQDGRFPRPAITESDGNELNLSSFPGSPRITCLPWTLIAVGHNPPLYPSSRVRIRRIKRCSGYFNRRPCFWGNEQRPLGSPARYSERLQCKEEQWLS